MLIREFLQGTRSATVGLSLADWMINTGVGRAVLTHIQHLSQNDLEVSQVRFTRMISRSRPPFYWAL